MLGDEPLATGTPVNMWTCEEDGAAPDALIQAPVELADTGRKILVSQKKAQLQSSGLALLAGRRSVAVFTTFQQTGEEVLSSNLQSE
jgi:hypothetical protein